MDGFEEIAASTIDLREGDERATKVVPTAAPEAKHCEIEIDPLIGSIRRECLDHVVLLDETHLRRILTRYFDYYHRARCHLSLDGDAPVSRPVHGAELGSVVALPIWVACTTSTPEGPRDSLRMDFW